MAGVSGGSGGSMGPGLAGLLRLGFTTAALRRRGIRSFPTFDGWRLEIGDWRLEFGDWNLELPPLPFSRGSCGEGFTARGGIEP